MHSSYSKKRTARAACIISAAAFACPLIAVRPLPAQSPPILVPPANTSRIRIAQITPPPPGTPQGQSTPQGVSTPQVITPGTSTQPGVSPTTPTTPIVPTVPTVPGVVVPVRPVVPFVPPAVTVPPGVVTPPTQVGPQVDIDVEAPPVVPPAPPRPAVPVFDDDADEEELPGIEETDGVRRGVRPYGGGHPTDWSWGCGGSPYRTHGRCDNWKVGCAWAVTVDGIVMTREHADLAALDAQMFANDPTGMIVGSFSDTGGPTLGDTIRLLPALEQFDHGPGARITFMSQVPKYVGYQIQVAYEGVEEWNSSIVYPKLPLAPPPLPPPGAPNDGIPGPAEFGTEQRRFHYRSSFHSGELNYVRDCDPVWRPYCGVRYIKFDDEINDFIDQQAPPPLPGSIMAPPLLGDPPREEDVLTTDRLNLFDLENNLIGFQVGLLHDSWRVNQRFALEGFFNTGVYYNKIKFTNQMATFRTQDIADNIDTDDFDEARIDFSDTFNNDVREYSEIAYVAEVSLTGVCRLNKCWALRAGYQALFIHNVHLAQDAYLSADPPAASNTDGRSLLFHGWHAGIECRR